MGYLYDKANEYLNGKNYSETPKSKTLEKVADYIFDITKQKVNKQQKRVRFKDLALFCFKKEVIW